MAKLKDMIGQKFGRLTVICRHFPNQDTHAMWLCKCDCGNEVVVSGGNLRFGGQKSCGCGAKIDSKNTKKIEVGSVFGRWTVIGRAGSSKDRHSMWKCLCECGEIGIIMGRELRNGNSTSCGCYHREILGELSRIDISECKFGRLTAKYISGRTPTGGTIWHCVCECGNETDVRLAVLRFGTVVSCGCYRADELRKRSTTHGLSKTKEYLRYYGHKRRELQRIYDSEWTLDMHIAISFLFKSCVVCGSDELLAVDHVYPLSKGYGLKPGNATMLCVHHNSRKTNKMPEELPSDIRDKILNSARMFKEYWDNLHP